MNEYLDLFELIVGLNDANPEVRQAAFDEMIALGHEAVPHLVDMFPDISGAARLHVVRALGEIGSLEAGPLLAELIISQDPNEYLFVSSMAVRSLGQIGAIELLIELLEAEAAGPRRMAATVLRNLCDERAVPGLIDGLSSPDPKVQQICADALTCIDTEEAREALRQWLDSQ